MTSQMSDVFYLSNYDLLFNLSLLFDLLPMQIARDIQSHQSKDCSLDCHHEKCESTRKLPPIKRLQINKVKLIAMTTLGAFKYLHSTKDSRIYNPLLSSGDSIFTGNKINHLN